MDSMTAACDTPLRLSQYVQSNYMPFERAVSLVAPWRGAPPSKEDWRRILDSASPAAMLAASVFVFRKEWQYAPDTPLAEQLRQAYHHSRAAAQNLFALWSASLWGLIAAKPPHDMMPANTRDWLLWLASFEIARTERERRRIYEDVQDRFPDMPHFIRRRLALRVQTPPVFWTARPVILCVAET